MSISFLVLGLALTSALTLTLTEKKHRHWPGSCQRCVGSGASPAVVAQSLLLRRARPAGISSARSRPPVGPPLPPPFSFPTGARHSPPTQPASTLNKLIDQASFGTDPRTRNGGHLVARLSPCPACLACLSTFFFPSWSFSFTIAGSLFSSRPVTQFYSALLDRPGRECIALCFAASLHCVCQTPRRPPGYLLVTVIYPHCLSHGSRARFCIRSHQHG